MTEESPIYTPSPGTITSLERQKKNQNRVSVFIDGTFAFGIHQDVLLQHMLYTGLRIELDTIEQIRQADQLIRAKTAAIHYLSYRARTEHEIRNKLKKDRFSTEIIEIVINRLYELSYIDDETFVRNYVRDRLNRKGHGPIRLKADLRKLGITPEQIDHVLENTTDKNGLFENALEQAKKRNKRLEREHDPLKKRRKLYSFLLRKGHTTDIVKEVLDHLDMEASR